MHVLVGYLLLRAKKNENVAKVVIIDDGDDDDDDDEYKVWAAMLKMECFEWMRLILKTKYETANKRKFLFVSLSRFGEIKWIY